MTGRSKRDEYGLLPRQYPVLEALLAGHTQASAANACGVGKRTVEAWCAEDAVFRAVLHSRQRALEGDVGRRVMAASGSALRVVLQLANDPGAPPAVRLAAARDVLDRAERYVDRAGALNSAAQKAAHVRLYEGLSAEDVQADGVERDDAQREDAQHEDAQHEDVAEDVKAEVVQAGATKANEQTTLMGVPMDDDDQKAIRRERSARAISELSKIGARLQSAGALYDVPFDDYFRHKYADFVDLPSFKEYFEQKERKRV